MATEHEGSADELQSAATGLGPMMQRDYWAVIDGCRCPPSGVLTMVASHFTELAPSDVVVFERDPDGPPGVLEVGDELDIRIRFAGEARVRVVHADTCSLTLATLSGHPEAGRITFGAYRNDDGDVVFRIRSRARASSLFSYIGFLAGGNPMQTTTWTDFVNAVAATCGAGVKGEVQAVTHSSASVELDEGDKHMDRPTFIARGD